MSAVFLRDNRNLHSNRRISISVSRGSAVISTWTKVPGENSVTYDLRESFVLSVKDVAAALSMTDSPLDRQV